MVMIRKNILKRTLALLLMLICCLTLLACEGGKDGDSNGDKGGNDGGGTTDGGSGDKFDPYPYDDLSVYMDLPTYKGLTIQKNAVDVMVKGELNAFCSAYDLYDAVPSTEAVQSGDLANIDYEGKIDGATFQGGSATAYDLLIGSGSFIDGFEDGVIGMKIGEKKDIDLTFPTDYYPEYAGKKVTFTVTLNRILRPSEITDEICQQYTEFSTAEDFMAALTNDCVFDYLWQQLMNDCKLKQYPNAEYTEYYQYFKSYFTSYAENYDMTLYEFISYYGDNFRQAGLFSGMTPAQFETVAQDYAKSQVVNDLLLYSIMRAENIQLEGAEWEAAVRQLETEVGKTYDELVSYYQDETVVIISVITIRVKNIITSSSQIVDN